MIFSSFTSMLEVLGKFNKMSENLTNWGKLNLNCNFKIVICLLDLSSKERKGHSANAKAFDTVWVVLDFAECVIKTHVTHMQSKLPLLFFTGLWMSPCGTAQNIFIELGRPVFCRASGSCMCQHLISNLHKQERILSCVTVKGMELSWKIAGCCQDCISWDCIWVSHHKHDSPCRQGHGKLQASSFSALCGKKKENYSLHSTKLPMKVQPRVTSLTCLVHFLHLGLASVD